MPEIINLESYPPVFRIPNGGAPPQISQLKSYSSMELEAAATPTQDSVPIPVVDFNCLSQELDKLGEACKDWGIFRLVNHEIPPCLLSKLQDHAKQLFSLSFESKQSLITNPMSYFWGTPALTPSGAALRGALNINWLEGLNVPLSQLPQFQSEDPMLDGFRYCLFSSFLLYFFFVPQFHC